MKKILITTILILLTAVAFAVNISALSDVSQGLFKNELDFAFQAGKEFLELDKNYVVTGLTNLSNKTLISSGDAKFTVGAFTTEFKNPWSVIVSASAKQNSNYGNTDSYTAYSHMATKYYDLSKFSFDLQALSVFKGNVGGFEFYLCLGDGTNLTSPYSLTIDAASYDSAGNITLRNHSEDICKVRPFTISLSSPWYFADKDMNITGQIEIENNSTTERTVVTTENFSTEEKTNSVEEDITSDVTAKVYVDFSKSINSPFFEDSNKSFAFGASLSLDLQFCSIRSDHYSEVNDSILSRTAYGATFNPAVNLVLSAGASQKIEAKISDLITFRIQPEARLKGVVVKDADLRSGYTKDEFGTLTLITSAQNVSSVNLGSLDIIPASESAGLGVHFIVSSALELKKPTSSFGAVFGAKARAVFGITAAKRDPALLTALDLTTEQEVTNNLYEKISSKGVYTNFICELDTNFGFVFDFADNGSLFVTANGNILDTGNISVQATIGF